MSEGGGQRVEQAFRPACIAAIIRWASAPEVPQRLKPHSDSAFSAALKRCSTLEPNTDPTANTFPS
jgi:hypothetical protein